MAKLDGPCFYRVDAHNVVPVWETSDQQELTPRDIRKKIMCKLGQFLTEFPPVVKHPVDTTYPCKVRLSQGRHPVDFFAATKLNFYVILNTLC